MKTHSLLDSIEPLAGIDKKKYEDTISKIMAQVVSLKFQALSQFCNLCFIKHRIETEKDKELKEKLFGKQKGVVLIQQTDNEQKKRNFAI